MRSHFTFRSTLFGLLAIPRLATAHTWVEQIMAIAPNGTLVGQPGYPRGNVLRGTPAFGDPAMVNLIPPDGRPINVIEPSDLMCKVSQVSQTQTDGSPRLQAAPGAAVALRFQENGHVTLPDGQPGKPPNRGTVFVYGTSRPSRDDSFLAIHRQWTADGSGGDGRGVLLSTRNFDDGQCYQVNGGPLSHQRQTAFSHQFNQYMGNDLWCQQDILLPADIPVGQPYTLYWVWDWPTLPGTPGYPDGKQELYTTCMDIDIVAGSGVDVFNKAQGSPGFVNQPLDQAAVKAQMADIANPTAVTGQFVPFSAGPAKSRPAATGSTLPPASTSSTVPVLTSSPGPSIPFSASATGPVAGAASEASAIEATAVTTGDIDFLTVHTASSSGFGVETQTFSVLPIVETSAPQGNGNGGFAFGNGDRGSGNRGASSLGESSTLAAQVQTVKLTIHMENAGNQGPQVTAAPNVNQAGLLTVTEYDPVTETIYQTVYETRYTKRDVGEYDSFSSFPPNPTGFTPGKNGHQWARGSSSPPPWTTGYPTGSAGLPLRGGTQGVSRPVGPPSWASLVGTAGSHSMSAGAPGFVPSGLSTSYVPYERRDSGLTPSAAPMVTPAPAIDIRSPEPQPDEHSTAHAVFRLRARNPFIWLGWQKDSTATVSSS